MEENLLVAERPKGGKTHTRCHVVLLCESSIGARKKKKRQLLAQPAASLLHLLKKAWVLSLCVLMAFLLLFWRKPVAIHYWEHASFKLEYFFLATTELAGCERCSSYTKQTELPPLTPNAAKDPPNKQIKWWIAHSDSRADFKWQESREGYVQYRVHMTAI